VIRPAVGHIVAGDGSDDNVFEVETFDALSDSLRFVGLEREGLGGIDGAKPTSARAPVAGNHERRRSAAPAFPSVGALGALANGVEAEIGNEIFSGKKDGVIRQPHFYPVRFFLLMQTRINLHTGHSSQSIVGHWAGVNSCGWRMFCRKKKSGVFNGEKSGKVKAWRNTK